MNVRVGISRRPAAATAADRRRRNHDRRPRRSPTAAASRTASPRRRPSASPSTARDRARASAKSVASVDDRARSRPARARLDRVGVRIPAARSWSRKCGRASRPLPALPDPPRSGTWSAGRPTSGPSGGSPWPRSGSVRRPPGPARSPSSPRVAGQHVGAVDDHAGNPVAGRAHGDVRDGQISIAAGTLIA